MHKLSLFTFIELLIVIAIFALLASLIQPSLGKIQSQAYELESSTDLRIIHSSTMFYLENENNLLPIKYLETTSGWKNIWVRTLQPYFELGSNDPALFSSKIELNHSFSDYAPNDYLIKKNTPKPISDIDKTSEELLFFEAAHQSNLYNSGAWLAWGKKIVNKQVYTTTIAHRHGPMNDPVFYGVFVDGHVERFYFYQVWEDNQRRRSLFSQH